MMVLVTINQEFGGLAESENISQPYEIKCFYPIQLCCVYLNVYQLKELTPRNGRAMITNARYRIQNKMIYRKSVHSVHF